MAIARTYNHHFKPIADKENVYLSSVLKMRRLHNYQYVDKGQTNKMMIATDSIHADILPNIVQYAQNSAFILILQNPSLNDYLPLLSYKIRMSTPALKANGSTEIVISDRLADSILKSDPTYKKVFGNKYNLWIATQTKTYGPLTLSEYLQKRKEFGVPEGLLLQF